MITGDGIPRSGNDNRGRRRDLELKELISKRQKKRKDIEEVDDFMEVMKRICPEYFT